MSSVPPTSNFHDGPTWLPRWLSPRRRRIVSSLLTLVVVIVVLAVTDPFASSSPGSGMTDNSSKTSTTKVVRENLSSQTSESATLGYAGHYGVVLPAGTSPTALLQARSTAAADQQNVVNAEAALANAKAIAGPERAATLLAAKAAVSSDETALASAKDQLASDEELSCPSSSSSTVTAAAHALSHDTTTTTTPASAPSPRPARPMRRRVPHLNSWVPSTRTVPRRPITSSTARARTTARPRRRSTLVQGRTTSQSAPSYRGCCPARPTTTASSRSTHSVPLTAKTLRSPPTPRPRRRRASRRRSRRPRRPSPAQLIPTAPRRPTTSSTARPRPSENRPPLSTRARDCGRISQRNDHGAQGQHDLRLRARRDQFARHLRWRHRGLPGGSVILRRSVPSDH